MKYQHKYIHPGQVIIVYVVQDEVIPSLRLWKLEITATNKINKNICRCITTLTNATNEYEKSRVQKSSENAERRSIKCDCVVKYR